MTNFISRNCKVIGALSKQTVPLSILLRRSRALESKGLKAEAKAGISLHTRQSGPRISSLRASSGGREREYNVSVLWRAKHRGGKRLRISLPMSEKHVARSQSCYVFPFYATIRRQLTEGLGRVNTKKVFCGAFRLFYCKCWYIM